MSAHSTNALADLIRSSAAEQAAAAEEVAAEATVAVERAAADIAGIAADAWTSIEYPHAVWDEEEQRWISDAEIAEVPFVAFTGRRKAEHVACRLVVRRVRRLQPSAGDGSEQGELFATYRHHAFITNNNSVKVPEVKTSADYFEDYGEFQLGVGHLPPSKQN